MKSNTKHLISIFALSAFSLNFYYVIDSQSGANLYPLSKVEKSFEDRYVFVNEFTTGESVTLNEPQAGEVIEADTETTSQSVVLVDEKKDIADESLVDALVKQDQGVVEADEPQQELLLVEEKPLEPQVETKSYVVGSGDSLIYLLKSSGLSSTEVKGIVYNSRAPKSAFNLMKGDGVEVTFDEFGSFKKLLILPKGATFYEITNVDGNYSHKKEIYPEELRELKKSFVISDSVYKDGLATGLTAAEVAKVIDVFQHKVDTSKVSKGEEFDVLLARVFANGKFTGKSVVKAIRYTKRGVSKYAFLWSKGDKEGYFDENGEGLMPSFMRHPVKNPRITSNYNPKRLHPILKIVRPHRGTDYGGNRKPIMAIADGKVVHAGKKGSFGNTVIIKHANGVQTLSAHMSKIMNGVKRGATVTKGQTVGLIGSTGVSTGPHLHFEMKIDGRYVNPLTAKLPMDDKVDNITEYKYSISKVMKTEGWD